MPGPGLGAEGGAVDRHTDVLPGSLVQSSGSRSSVNASQHQELLETF